MEATARGTCVFRTGGTITLNSGPIVVTNPFITIAGETAPGGGIAIRNGRTQVRPSIEIRTHDVVIRHLRLRPGPHWVPGCCSGGLGLYTPAAHDIMLDHISASWGSDETVDSKRRRTSPGSGGFSESRSCAAAPTNETGPATCC